MSVRVWKCIHCGMTVTSEYKPDDLYGGKCTGQGAILRNTDYQGNPIHIFHPQ